MRIKIWRNLQEMILQKYVDLCKIYSSVIPGPGQYGGPRRCDMRENDMLQINSKRHHSPDEGKTNAMKIKDNKTSSNVQLGMWAVQKKEIKHNWSGAGGIHNWYEIVTTNCWRMRKTVEWSGDKNHHVVLTISVGVFNPPNYYWQFLLLLLQMISESFLAFSLRKIVPH